MTKIYDITILLVLIIIVANIIIYELIKNSNNKKKENVLLSSSLEIDDIAPKQQITLSECNNASDQATTKCNGTTTNTEVKTNYIEKYPQYMSCKTSYNEWNEMFVCDCEETSRRGRQLYNTRFVRGLVAGYFPLDGDNDDELKRLYRSWIHMLQFEPPKWRTDLIIFVKNDRDVFDNGDFFLNLLNCGFDNVRLADDDAPMCTLIDYEPLNERNFTVLDDHNWESENQLYDHLLNSIDIFNTRVGDLDPFYKLINKAFDTYGYPNDTDSILAAFEGYEYFKSAGYDFLFRVGLGTLITAQFATWLPYNCNGFHVGKANYSSEFNTKRLRRTANYMGLKYACEENVASTWYSTPDQIRLVSYLTLFATVYLAEEEFSPVERDRQQIQDLLSPDWHYPNLSLYAQNLVINHLIATKQAIVGKLDGYSLFNSSRSINDVIYVYEPNLDMLSKDDVVGNHDEIYSYYLKIALESKRLSSLDLANMLEFIGKKKS